ncbi:hypothetical protein SEA_SMOKINGBUNNY_65 [Gordonia phage SmokingBunny]|uniref:Uncharacterized protein n=2 Tax=Wizardvirus TaxID=2169658 RepID=A0A515MHK0_9CAUD|nr:hypothetical protein KNU53_gp65 [Gordonia phage SmokingBunny]YP_010103078.1 hypothetical protein KNU63_gp68 [Gordonia phage RogerDodger]QCG77876.1 hypothetical protein SEA_SMOKINGBUNNY_65 [Gordonia phage SmokingBunny]QDM56150.1 hypothetical protein SEA_ROGERDODGER_68 [Gordonia phage RogerDodger]WAA20282.1 hypothetical protein SEA_TOGO_64 [Gordonia phage Togo]
MSAAQELWGQELADSKVQHDVRQLLRGLDAFVRRANDPDREGSAYPDELLPRDLVRDLSENVTKLHQELVDTRARLNAVRQQRDEATQQLLDERATVSLLRRKLARQTALRYASRIGYCDSAFTPPDGGDTLTCALDAGHPTNLHHDAGNTWAWTTDGATVVGMIPGGVR